MGDLVTTDTVEQWAEWTLQEWLDGPSPVLEDGSQRRLDTYEKDDYNIVLVQDKYDHRHPDRKFRISVQVEEIK
jgi:hypothetical protein